MIKGLKTTNISHFFLTLCNPREKLQPSIQTEISFSQKPSQFSNWLFSGFFSKTKRLLLWFAIQERTGSDLKQEFTAVAAKIVTVKLSHLSWQLRNGAVSCTSELHLFILSYVQTTRDSCFASLQPNEHNPTLLFKSGMFFSKLPFSKTMLCVMKVFECWFLCNLFRSKWWSYDEEIYISFFMVFIL